MRPPRVGRPITSLDQGRFLDAYGRPAAGIRARRLSEVGAMRTRLAAVVGTGVVLSCTAAALHFDSGSSRAKDARGLRLELALRSHSAEVERGSAAGPARAARPSALRFAVGSTVARARLRASVAGAPTFGQPTISGVAGVGFEQDLRLDPASAQRVYTSVPGSLSSDTSGIWRAG